MTENKRFELKTNEGFVVSLKDNLTKQYPFSISCECIDDYENVIDEAMSVGVLLNQLWEQALRFDKYNTEKLKKYACHDTLIIIEELCDAVLNYSFKDVHDKVDFCHMLNKIDNKDLAFLKECFTAIRNNDLKQMTSLKLECDVE